MYVSVLHFTIKNDELWILISSKLVSSTFDQDSAHANKISQTSLQLNLNAGHDQLPVGCKPQNMHGCKNVPHWLAS
jgi:hypothetical protein